MKRLLSVFVASLVLGLSVSGLLKAQSTWGDTRHEVTVRNDPQSFQCSVVNNAGTGLAAFGGQCAAPTIVNQSFYITDITATSSAVATVTADQYLELKSGTGTNCGTGTAVVWAAYNPATSGPVANFVTPIKVAANSDLCWMDAVTGSKSIFVQGYVK